MIDVSADRFDINIINPDGYDLRWEISINTPNEPQKIGPFAKTNLWIGYGAKRLFCTLMPDQGVSSARVRLVESR